MRTTSNSCAPLETHVHHQQLTRTTSNSCAPHILSAIHVSCQQLVHTSTALAHLRLQLLDLLSFGLLTLGLSFRFTWLHLVFATARLSLGFAYLGLANQLSACSASHPDHNHASQLVPLRLSLRLSPRPTSASVPVRPISQFG